MSNKHPNFVCSVQSGLDSENRTHLRPVYYPWKEIRGLYSAHRIPLPCQGKSSFVVKLKLPRRSSPFDLSSFDNNSSVSSHGNINNGEEHRDEPSSKVLNHVSKRDFCKSGNLPLVGCFKRIKQFNDMDNSHLDSADKLFSSQLTSYLPQNSKSTLDSNKSVQSPFLVSSISNQNLFDGSESLNTLRDCFIRYFQEGCATVPGNRFENPWESAIFLELAHFLGIITKNESQTQEYNPNNIFQRPILKRKKKLKMFQMIYSKVIKGLQKSFLEGRNKPLNYTTRFKDNRDFFEYYFQSLAEKSAEDLSVYDHFKNTINSNLSYTFLKRVFQSDTFKADFLNYLNNQFISDYRKERTERIQYLFTKWKKLISTVEHSPNRKLELIKKEINCPNFKFVLDDKTIMAYVEKFKSVIAENFKLRARSKTSASRRTTLI